MSIPKLRRPDRYLTNLSLGFNWALDNLQKIDPEFSPGSPVPEERRQAIIEFIMGRKVPYKLDTDPKENKELVEEMFTTKKDGSTLYSQLRNLLREYRNYHCHVCHKDENLNNPAPGAIAWVEKRFNEAKEHAYKKIEEYRLATIVNEDGKTNPDSASELNAIIDATHRKMDEITLFDAKNKRRFSSRYGVIFFMNIFLYKWQANFILSQLRGFKATNITEYDGIDKGRPTKFYGKPRREFFTFFSLRDGFQLFSEAGNYVKFRQIVNLLYTKPIEYERIVNPTYYEKKILSRDKKSKEQYDQLNKTKQQKEKNTIRRNTEKIFIEWACRSIEDSFTANKRSEENFTLAFRVYEKGEAHSRQRKHDGVTAREYVEKIKSRVFAPGALHDYKYVITHKMFFSGLPIQTAYMLIIRLAYTN